VDLTADLEVACVPKLEYNSSSNSIQKKGCSSSYYPWYKSAADKVYSSGPLIKGRFLTIQV
jgi:hypothetical protein